VAGSTVYGVRHLRFCLIGGANPCHNPRLVREADALVRAGYQVRVVAIGTMREHADSDARLLASRAWQLQRVDLFPDGQGRRLRLHWMRARRRLAEHAFRYAGSATFAEYSCCACLPELTAFACAEPADWFIAHAQPALPVAAAAAKRWNARLGFDCEDLLAETDGNSDAIRLVEQRYLPQCEYISAASYAMAERLVERHDVTRPVVLYNVFPSSLADGLSPPNARPRHSRLRLHWFSQTLGTDRGLQDVFEACSGLADQVEIHLRGHGPGTQAEKAVLSLAEQNGLRSTVKLHPLIHHDQVIASMGDYDVGLALERSDHPNYSRTVTNKVFSYLLAGLAIAATDTLGQREIMSQIPAAGALYPTGNSRGLRQILEHWLTHPEQLRQAQRAAWDAARQKFCWDLECAKFLRLLGKGTGDLVASAVSVPA